MNVIGSGVGRDRAVWSANGLPRKERPDQVDEPGRRDEARQTLIRENARELVRP